jgi:hypothetical protein
MSASYASSARIDSTLFEGVTFVVDRMSFGRRLELMKAVREVSAKFEFHAAARDEDKMKVGLLAAEVDRIYVRWGLREIEGILIDGEAATPQTLSALGPEELFLEALAAVKSVCGLSDTEKKT